MNITVPQSNKQVIILGNTNYYRLKKLNLVTPLIWQIELRPKLILFFICKGALWNQKLRKRQ